MLPPATPLIAPADAEVPPHPLSCPAPCMSECPTFSIMTDSYAFQSSPVGTRRRLGRGIPWQPPAAAMLPQGRTPSPLCVHSHHPQSHLTALTCCSLPRERSTNPRCNCPWTTGPCVTSSESPTKQIPLPVQPPAPRTNYYDVQREGVRGDQYGNMALLAAAHQYDASFPKTSGSCTALHTPPLLFLWKRCSKGFVPRNVLCHTRILMPTLTLGR